MVKDIDMKSHLYFLLYLLVLGNTLKLNFTSSSNDFRLRFVYTNKPSALWLQSSNISALTLLPLEDKNTKLHFEFQNIHSGSIDKTREYAFWNKNVVYKDYIDKVNSKLISN